MITVVRVFLFTIMALDHLMKGEAKWFTPMGIAAMWAGAGCAARGGAL